MSKSFCSKCKQNKSVKQFYKCSSRSNGLQYNCKTCCKGARKDYYKVYAQKERFKVLSKYWPGCSEIEVEFNYNTLLSKQNMECAICHAHQKTLDKNLAVDHCHKTGKVRGLLCSYCNRALGFFKDSLDIIENSKKYLLKHITE